MMEHISQRLKSSFTSLKTRRCSSVYLGVVVLGVFDHTCFLLWRIQGRGLEPLYEYQSLIFSHLSWIRHLVCDTSFGHIRRSLHYLWTIATRKKRKKEKRKKERDPELNSVLHGRVKMLPTMFMNITAHPCHLNGNWPSLAPHLVHTQ